MTVLNHPVMVGAEPCSDLGIQADSGLWPMMSSLVVTTTSWPPASLLHSYWPGNGQYNVNWLLIG